MQQQSLRRTESQEKLATPSAPPQLALEEDELYEKHATPSAPPPSYASLFPERVASLEMQDVFGLFAETKPAENKYEKALADIDFRLFAPQSSQPDPQPERQSETEEERDARIETMLAALPSASTGSDNDDEPPIENNQQRNALPG